MFKRETVIFRMIILAFVGAGINMIFFSLVLWQLANSVLSHPIIITQNTVGMLNQTTIPILQGTIVAVIQNATGVPPQPSSFQLTESLVLDYSVYIVVSLIYCLAVSLAFKPKRIVSPLLTQGLTVAFMTIEFVIPFTMYTYLLHNQQAVENALGILILASAMLILVGFIQTELIRRWVGLNEPLEEIDKHIVSFDIDFKKMKEIMLSDEFLSLGGFKRKKNKSHEQLILESSSRDSEKLVFVLSADKKDERSYLAGIPYQISYNTISKSAKASAWMESIILFLKERSKKYEENKQDEGTTFAYALAMKHVLDSTKPKINNLITLPSYEKTALIVTSIIWVLLTATWYFKFITLEGYFTTLVLISIELMFVFLPALIEKAKGETED